MGTLTLIKEEVVVTWFGMFLDDCFVLRDISDDHATSGSTGLIWSSSSISFGVSFSLFSSMNKKKKTPVHS